MTSGPTLITLRLHPGLPTRRSGRRYPSSRPKRSLPVTGNLAIEMQGASHEFGGHCLALTLLGSYLTDAYNGDVRCRRDVSEHLTHDVRQGVHARKVMESYQIWFGEGPELSLLRMLGLFDRPADEKALLALLKLSPESATQSSAAATQANN